MAAEYYIPGSITVLVTQFSPNPNNVLGYAYLGQNMLLSAPEKWFAILDSFSAIAATGTTLLHEVGHLFSKWASYNQNFSTFYRKADPRWAAPLVHFSYVLWGTNRW